ncbi:MAG: NAD(P)/FAD-dependent oxidoreductase [Lysobacter sp.]
MNPEDSEPTRIDCLVIGGGPAGLTAATYLARFRRNVLLVDAGQSRARWIPASHNCPGFPFGVAGNELLARFREHAERYQVPIATARIETLQRKGDLFVAKTAAEEWLARTVILATGVVDRLPEFEMVEEAIATGAVRLCAICDGYEAKDDAIAVLAGREEAISHSEFLRTFSRSVTAIATDGLGDDPALQRRAHASDVALLPAPLRWQLVDGCCEAIYPDGSRQRFDTLYPVLGSNVQSSLLVSLGAAVDDEGALIVSDHMETSIPGAFAIGDVVSALNQISVAVGHAAIAATAVHGNLPPNPR